MANGNKKRARKKIFIFGGLAFLLIVVVLVVVFGGDKEAIISVQTEKAQKRTITQIVSATGSINPVRQVVITPEITGEIVELPVEEGDAVQKGDLLIRINPKSYVAQKESAQAQLESAKAQLKVREASLSEVKAEYERMQGLYEKNLASDQELESAKSTYLQAEGNYEAQKAAVTQAQGVLDEAAENLAKTTIYSPIDGTVTALNVELSERVLGSGYSQGTEIMTVAALGAMEATVDVDENDVVLVSVGDTAKIEIDAFRDKTFLGTVTQIGNSASTTGSGTQDEVVNFEVKIRLLQTHSEIRPGMSCDADIETETKENIIAVPIQSVTVRTLPEEGNGDEDGNNDSTVATSKEDEPEEVVFIVDNNSAKVVPVETGISDDTYIEIVSGLEGEETVVSGSYRAISKELSDGSKVSIQNGNHKPADNDEE